SLPVLPGVLLTGDRVTVGGSRQAVCEISHMACKILAKRPPSVSPLREVVCEADRGGEDELQALPSAGRLPIFFDRADVRGKLAQGGRPWLSRCPFCRDCAKPTARRSPRAGPRPATGRMN